MCPACRRAVIEDFRFHDLRHTFASQVLLHRGDLKDIQELLGHKTMTMTLRYAHLTQEHKRKAVNLLIGQSAGVKKDEHIDCHKTVTFSHLPKSVGA
ncbi:MAG: tyrosine-type recombinase/integrase [Deltaproteobacteria bacterium]|nr:tyrosine-type recombinase/integrase [Deltaproteobacteria bacterium]